jgi:hypothetical protein
MIEAVPNRRLEKQSIRSGEIFSVYCIHTIGNNLYKNGRTSVYKDTDECGDETLEAMRDTLEHL